MKPLKSIDSKLNFQGNQIVCLEHENSFLYAEVIEVIAARKTCWVRPWILKVLSFTNNNLPEFEDNPIIFDLRESAHLVLPISLFRAALDTELIPLLSELDNLESQEQDLILSRQKLRQFVESLWQAYKPVFSQTNQ